MAEPARRPDAVGGFSPLPDPIAVERAYRFHKTRRRIRQERKQERFRAPAFLRHPPFALGARCVPVARRLAADRATVRPLTGASRILPAVESPETYPPEAEPEETPDRSAPDAAWVWGAGERLTWLGGMVLALSTLMGRYVNSLGRPDRGRDRLAYRRLGEGRAADRPRRRRPAPAPCGRHCAPCHGSGEPGRDRARPARDDLRPIRVISIPDDFLAGKPRHRDLDLADFGCRGDRRRLVTSLGRALARLRAQQFFRAAR